jgi:hypothetical protein
MILPARTNNVSLPRDASTAPTSVGQPDNLEAFSDIMLGYIGRMLMAENIDNRLEHYLKHLALFARWLPQFPTR